MSAKRRRSQRHEEAVEEMNETMETVQTEPQGQEVQQEVSTRFMLTMALALHDVFGFGTDRIERVMNAMGEIAVGYSDESYKPSEKRSGLEDMRRMTLAMAGELGKRGIRVKIE